MTTEWTPMEQNHTTVAFMQSQDFQSAVHSSIIAMEYAQQFFEAEGMMMLSSSNRSSISSGFLDHQCLLFSASDDEDERASSIYDQAILIAPTMMASPAMVTPILIFNAALAHHLVAKERNITHICRRTRTRMLHRAKQLYELVYDSLDEEDNNLLFQFAIIANLAHVEREIGNVSRANECFEHLMYLMVLFVDQRNSPYLRHVHQRFANFIPLPIRSAPAA